MQKSKAPVAGTKEPKPRQSNTGRVNVTIEQGGAPATGDGRDDENQTEPSTNTTQPTETGGTPEVPERTTYDTIQRLRSPQPRQAMYASAVAATEFANFNDSDPEFQPAELYTYTDVGYIRRGHI